MASDRHNDDFRSLEGRRSFRSRVDLILQLYVIAGVVIAFASAGFLILSFIRVELTETQQLAAMLAIVGLAVSLFSGTYLYFKKKREKQDIANSEKISGAMSFLETWNKFESVSSSILSAEKSDFKPHSIRSILSSLAEENRIDDEDKRTIERALDLRNSILHRGDMPPPQYIDEVASSLFDVIVKISPKDAKI